MGVEMEKGHGLERGVSYVLPPIPTPAERMFVPEDGLMSAVDTSMLKNF